MRLGPQTRLRAARGREAAGRGGRCLRGARGGVGVRARGVGCARAVPPARAAGRRESRPHSPL